ncbi:M48 family metalloprotease [Haloterrigena sp. SYSU A558-1]|uniref:Protease HtpX homolog n=1 Tax=Haloterrigena gelatinilytica TaxID=2741724 RepID=A0ABX2LDM5_9EURY|nr:M48 family metalloprotease [Haloterrigena gelatinilytica]NUC73249.1 M48 family metalloprotease [Haloterrigena gelatinilytica]
MEWPADWGLRVRMLATMVLLLTVYLIIASGIATVIVGYTSGGGTVVYGLLALGFAGVHYWYAAWFLPRGLGATAVDPDEYPDLHATVERLARQADLPTPTIAVVDAEVPNAFVTGHSQRSATITVTSGLLDTLEGEQREAVLAHELAHVKNRDAIAMTLASFLPTIALVILVASGLAFDGRDGGHDVPSGVVVLAPVSIVAWLVGSVFVRLFARHREIVADSGAVAITGDPSALAAALRSLSDELERVPDEDLRSVAELNAFFVVPVQSGFVGRFLSTHPPVERRIERLQRLERQLA